MATPDLDNLYQHIETNMDSYQSIAGNDELEFALARWPILRRITHVISTFEKKHHGSISQESNLS